MIRLENISKSFNKKTVLPNFLFHIKGEHFYTIIGPNGCGKSTLLSIIAGTIESDCGRIIKSQNLKIGYVWQNYRASLFPWLSIAENISFPLKIQKVPSKERKDAVKRLIEEFDIKIDLEKKIYDLSGGQQQLICILRALIIEPELILLDEPFSALDQYVSWHVGFQLEKMWLKNKNSVFFVSHDVDEAVLLADEIILMNRQGYIEKIIQNHMTRNRSIEMMTAEEHLKCKNEIVEFLFDQNKK